MSEIDEARAILGAREGETLAEAARRFWDTCARHVEAAERERDEARAKIKRLRVQCVGCADAESRTGSAHYVDCPVYALLAEVERVRTALRLALGDRDYALALGEEEG